LGIIALLLVLSTYLLSHSSRSLPVEVVKVAGGGLSGPGGGGGKEPIPEERPDLPEPVPGAVKVPDKPIQPIPVKAPPEPITFEQPSQRELQDMDTQAAKAVARLGDAAARIRISDGNGKPGPGGPGPGGPGGDGNGKGPDKGKLTPREKRMLRWKMQFNTANGRDYVRQLHGLGAILAIPSGRDGDKPKFQIIRDLGGRPPKLLDDDISKIQRIYWIDDNPKSVADVMDALKLKVHPDKFIAFMPEELEKNLFRLEKARLEKDHPGKTEDDILETEFRINVKGAKSEPELSGLWLR
jgi:hypothetical protein